MEGSPYAILGAEIAVQIVNCACVCVCVKKGAARNSASDGGRETSIALIWSQLVKKLHPWGPSLGPGLPAWVTRNDQSLPYGVQFFHQSGPYESYGGLPTTIRRRISIRVFLDGSWGCLKQDLHQNSETPKSGYIFSRIGSIWELWRSPDHHPTQNFDPHLSR